METASDIASTAPAARIHRSDEPSPDPAALVARWESLDESRRSAAVAHGHARALARLLRGVDSLAGEIPCETAGALAVLVGTIKDAADARFADHDHATALALHAAGPAEVGPWRYRGANHGGLWVVVKELAGEFAVAEDEGERPPVAGHACVAIEGDDDEAA